MSAEILVGDRYERKSVLSRRERVTTYLAMDRATRAVRVLKELTLPKDLAVRALEAMEPRFRALSKIDHPHIPKFLELFLDEFEGKLRVCLVLEHIQGKTLAHSVKGGRRFLREDVFKLARDCASALAALHEAQPALLHGSLHPGHILLGSYDRPYLIDFGLVELGFAAAGLPAPNDEWAEYVPFEQFCGRPVPASDLYALGLSLAYAASGHSPLALSKDKPWAPIAVASVSPDQEVRDLVLELTRPEWDARPGRADDVRTRAESTMEGWRPGARRDAPIRRVVRVAGLAAAVWAVFLLFWSRRTPPHAVDRPSRASPPRPTRPEREDPGSERAGPWQRVPGTAGDSLDVKLEGGDVWILNKYAVVRCPEGEPLRAAVAVDHRTPIAKTPAGVAVPRLPTLSAFGFRGGELWLGSWSGDTMRLTDAGIEILSTARAPLCAKVESLAAAGGTMYAASCGRLWAWDDAQGAWAQVAGVPSHVGAAASLRDGRLAVLGDRSAYALEGSRWQRLSGDPGPGEATALVEGPDGRRWLGYQKGGYRLVNDRGGAYESGLHESWLTSFAFMPDGRVWAGAWQGGLRLRSGNRWLRYGYAEGLPDDDVAGLAVDRRGRLWVALYGYGAITLPAQEAASLVQSTPPPTPIAGSVFASLAEAAREVLGEGSRASGRVAAEHVLGETTVFLDGRAAAARAWRREDGTLAALRADGSGELRARGRTAAIPAPDPPGASLVFLDSRGRVWASTQGGGLRHFDGKEWTAVPSSDLAGGTAWALAEDRLGRIWIGTRPPDVNRNAPPLHRLEGGVWSHYGESHGLRGAVSALAPLASGELAVAHWGGLTLVSDSGLRGYRHHELGLPGSFIRALAEDADGRLWAAHWDGGLSWLDGGRFRVVDSRGGLFSDRVQALALDGERRLWLLADDGRAGVFRTAALAEASR